MQENVLFIHNALTMDEQISLFQDLKDRDKTEFYAKFANNPRAKLNAQFKKRNDNLNTNEDEKEKEEGKRKKRRIR